MSCTKELTGLYNAENRIGIFFGKTVPVPSAITTLPPLVNVLGDSTVKKEKHIMIDLAKQLLYAYEDNRLVFAFLISSGKWGRTPTGDFHIWTKLRYTRMTGGNPAINTFYDLPNVPYTMFFYNDEIPKERGYGIHGTYWHDNFGHPMSHGCINMKTENVALLYQWADPTTNTETIVYADAEHPGTPITIYGEAPQE